MYTANMPIVGTHPEVDEERLIAAVIHRKSPQSGYTSGDIRHTIVPTYRAVCTFVGLDAVMLIAQMLHETGNLASWWSQRPRRNPAGIGVTGRWRPWQPKDGRWERDGLIWREGVAFSSWEHTAIPAQAGRLLAYALPISDAILPAQYQLIMQALSVRSLPDHYRGIAPTWLGLVQTWAVSKVRPPVGQTYADKIAAIANQLMQ